MSNIFLPDPIKKERSLLTSHGFLALYSFLALLLTFGVYLVIQNSEKILGYATNISIGELLNDTNDIRKQKGLGSLIINSSLSKAAEQKARDMFEDDYWAHTAPDGKEPWDFIKAQGYTYIYAGENLAVDFSESDDVVKAWYESPSHRDNLLNPNYTEIGFAVVNGELKGRKTTLVVQMFGKPRNTPTRIAASTEDTTNALLTTSNNQPTETSSNTQEITTNANVNQDNPNTVVATLPGSSPPDESILDQIDLTEEFAAGSVLNSNDVFSVSRYLAILLGAFISLTFVVDGYYVRKIGIHRISGHTLLHVMMLILAIFGVWYTNIGLVL